MGAIPSALLFLLLVILPATLLCRAWDRKTSKELAASQDNPPEEIDAVKVDEIKNPALRARAELYQNRERPEKVWPSPGEKLCGTPFVKAGEKVPAESIKKQGHTRTEIILSVVCLVLVIASSILGYKVYEYREMVIAFVHVNEELLEENKAMEAEIEAAHTDGVDSYTMGYLEARERLGLPYFVASKESHVYHGSNCAYLDAILEENRIYYTTEQSAIEDGKTPCSVCRP